MKKILIGLVVAFSVVSCGNRQFNQAMKSADKSFILETANEYYAQKKWKNALALYERATNFVAGTDDFPNVAFNTAYANYYDESYKLAGHQFKNFANNFPKDPRAEEAAYFSALCYYQDSMDYNLDQTSTELAINELQNFINNYPNSERSKNIGEMIEELSYKQEFKAYENAKQYFKMGEYKASNVAFENVLEDFPATKLRSKIYDYIMNSRYELAMNSNFDLKSERIENALAYTRFVEKELPGTEYLKDALDLREKLESEKVRFNKVKLDVEAQKVKFEAKQKSELAKKEKEQLKKAKQDQITVEQALKDSAKAATPAASTFKIKR